MKKLVFLLSAACLMGTACTFAAMKAIDVPNQISYPVGWPAADSTVAAAFADQDIPETTTLYFWDESSSSYDEVYYLYGEWSDPNHVIHTAHAFYINSYDDSGTHTFYLHYSPLPSQPDYFDVTLTAGRWHFLSYAWDMGQKGCVLEQPWASQYYYLGWLYWPGNCVEDSVLTFSYNGSWSWLECNRFNDCSRKWDCTGDQLSPHFPDYWYALWFYNEQSTRTWRQYSTPGTE